MSLTTSSSAEPTTWLLVPARSGSKSVPRTMLRGPGGKPLIRHVLDELEGHASRDRVVVSTDSDRIARLCRSLAIMHARPALLELDEQRRLDIDTPSDWTMAERFVSQRPVAGASAR